MKRVLITVVMLVVTIPAFSQLIESKDKKKNSPCPKVYFGVSTGINNPNGILGFNFDIPIVNYVTVGAGVGVSSWGNKVYAEGRYYLRPCQQGFAFAGGITHNSGVSHFERKLETVDGKRQVTVNLYQETNLYLAVYHFWKIGHRHNRFFVDAGYSVPLYNARYKQIDGPQLSDDGINEVKRIAPGGLMIGTGFSFGIQ
jgi:hypothetical protein